MVSFRVLFGTQSYSVTGSLRNRLPWQITGVQVVFSAPITTADVNSLTGLTLPASPVWVRIRSHGQSFQLARAF